MRKQQDWYGDEICMFDHFRILTWWFICPFGNPHQSSTWRSLHCHVVFLSTSSVSTSLTWHDHYVPRCCMWNGWSFNIFNGKEFLSPTLDSCNETFGDLEMKTLEDYMEHLQNQHDDEEPRVHESDASQLLASNIKNKHATKASVQFESIWGTWTSTAHHPTNISIS